MKRVIIVHGYKGKPDTNWKPWLKGELEQAGIAVQVPAMPNTDHPIADEWLQALADSIGEPDDSTFLVGHSLGCITILRYLESLDQGGKIGECIFVAGFTERFDGYKGGHDSFFDHELDWQKIRGHCDRFVAIHSDDDQIVGISQLENFERRLGARTITMHGVGHFSSADGVFELPLVRDELISIANRRVNRID